MGLAPKAKSDFAQIFTIGKIYTFLNPTFSSNVLHHHVCVGFDNYGAVFLICATSQFETLRKYYAKNGLSESGLVTLKPSGNNTLKVSTFVDCNEAMPFTIDELHLQSTIDRFFEDGEVSESELLQIRTGIESSDLLDGETIELIVKQLPN